MLSTLARRSPLETLFGEGFDSFDGARMMPAVDVSEDDTSITIRAELPGISPDEVEVTIEEGTLYLKGEKKQEKKEGGSYECSYGSFYRAFGLGSVDADKASAQYKDGVLTIAIPKKPEKATKVAISRG
jgi:HSP20 family protein